MKPMAVYLPREVVYSDGTSAMLSDDYILRDGALKLFIPKIDGVVNSLKAQGFYEDEKHNLVRPFYDVWDLRVIIYSDGFIVGRLGPNNKVYPIIPSIYEPFAFYKYAYNKFHIYDAAAKKWIKEVKSHYIVVADPSSGMTLVTVAPLVDIGILWYALSRLEGV